eukprot:gnl/Chilomastix_cuspidata/5043.p1 GENE.gnl/Chilomastix_cuspidata/5043~~gnl/Chilomastix_cuspidata/5043.p1  ORF type:complete len:583 (-),score=154.98 gnl/Chilomastix_cuspidata/5043:30-1778(-)
MKHFPQFVTSRDFQMLDDIIELKDVVEPPVFESLYKCVSLNRYSSDCIELEHGEGTNFDGMRHSMREIREFARKHTPKTRGQPYCLFSGPIELIRDDESEQDLPKEVKIGAKRFLLEAAPNSKRRPLSRETVQQLAAVQLDSDGSGGGQIGCVSNIERIVGGDEWAHITTASGLVERVKINRTGEASSESQWRVLGQLVPSPNPRGTQGSSPQPILSQSVPATQPGASQESQPTGSPSNINKEELFFQICGAQPMFRDIDKFFIRLKEQAHHHIAVASGHGALLFRVVIDLLCTPANLAFIPHITPILRAPLPGAPPELQFDEAAIFWITSALTEVEEMYSSIVISSFLKSAEHSLPADNMYGFRFRLPGSVPEVIRRMGFYKCPIPDVQGNIVTLVPDMLLPALGLVSDACVLRGVKGKKELVELILRACRMRTVCRYFVTDIARAAAKTPDGLGDRYFFDTLFPFVPNTGAMSITITASSKVSDALDSANPEVFLGLDNWKCTAFMGVLRTFKQFCDYFYRYRLKVVNLEKFAPSPLICKADMFSNFLLELRSWFKAPRWSVRHNTVLKILLTNMGNYKK